ncbi:MAG TPA: protein-glutamate O-methyltransferase CheR, partial [Nitrospiraceae bacterium]|nr:protein-glutamate O-methyltransferase CheR [Nitrospiraceae bacterium]
MELSLTTFFDLRNLIYAQSGIFFQDNKKYVLEGRLQARLRERNCATYEEYCDLLKYDSMRDKELATLFSLVTTNETYFYRDLPQLQAFTDMIIPEAVESNHASMRIQIWSAACSTGDEPYTLAMMMLEHPALMNWTIEILASDISDTVLTTARKGTYGEYSVRNVPANLLKKYFTVEEGQYVLAPVVKRLVKFVNINLYEASRSKMVRGMDAVFCRNCLIYFDDKAKQKIVNHL